MFTICSTCGNTQNNHRYRHTFSDPCVNVECNEKKTRFTVDCFNYPVLTRYSCSVPNCSIEKELHETLTDNFSEIPEERIQVHKYVEKKTEYRKVIFVLPADSECCQCGTQAQFHMEKEHNFQTRVELRNASEFDEVVLEHPMDRDYVIVPVVQK